MELLLTDKLKTEQGRKPNFHFYTKWDFFQLPDEICWQSTMNFKDKQKTYVQSTYNV